MISQPDLQDLPNRGTVPPASIQVPSEQVEDVSIINLVSEWGVSNTSSAESTELPQQVFKTQFRSILRTSLAEVRMLLTLVRGTRTAPTSDTSPSAEWTTLLTSEVFEEFAPDSAPTEPAIQRMSELRAKWDSGTSNAAPSEAQEETGAVATEQAPPEPIAKLSPQATHRAIAELRRISGLTSEQVGRLFGVSRRSIHAWISGNPLNARNEERLMRALDVIRYADRGFARDNRVALFDTSKGPAPYDLLAEQKFDEAREALGQGTGRPRRSLPELSPEARAALEPLRPEVLLNANPDPIHGKPGRIRAARTTRNKRRGHS